MIESLGIGIPHWPTITLPDFFFHYIIAILCAIFILCIGVLKFKYFYWYSQPLTFRFTLRRWFYRSEKWNTSIMTPLNRGHRDHDIDNPIQSLDIGRDKAIIYPFINYVNYQNITVFRIRTSVADNYRQPSFERIAEFLSRKDTEIDAPSRHIRENRFIRPCIPYDTLQLILSENTYGLSVFIGVMTAVAMSEVASADTASIKGVCILTPRIMLSFTRSHTIHRSVSIYVCEHLAWARYITSERESLELLETTEYIQKSREIAGEQTLYRYHEIPGFVIPFSTVYTYALSLEYSHARASSTVTSVVKVSSTNFALFYAFINECSRDFQCCIFNEITHLQHLVQHGIYHIYMLLMNQTRVLAIYVFAPSWNIRVPDSLDALASRTRTRPRTRTRGNRIDELHKHIADTSTALVKYLPPVIPPKYDAFGKRVPRTSTAAGSGSGSVSDANDTEILYCISSVYHKTLCASEDFIRGFHDSLAKLRSRDGRRRATASNIVLIDTIAHNYRIIDDAVIGTNSATVLWKNKWYYILYNAIIHEETLCKDILIL